MNNKNIRLATQQDIPKLVALMNAAYRSNVGWTHEYHIVSGERINAQQLGSLLSQTNVELFVLKVNQDVIGCIGLTTINGEVEIGSFAIDPQLQNSGYGKILLEFAEHYVIQNSIIRQLVMSVLNVRHELITYYERRGYCKTGETQAYPLDANVGVPQIPLHLVMLKKVLTSSTRII